MIIANKLFIFVHQNKALIKTMNKHYTESGHYYRVTAGGEVLHLNANINLVNVLPALPKADIFYDEIDEADFFRAYQLIYNKFSELLTT